MYAASGIRRFRSLRTLEEKGCILRSVNQDDRRNIYVEVTDTGKKLLKEVEEILSDFADAVFGQLGEDTIEQLNQYLCRLLQTAKRNLNAENIRVSEQEGETKKMKHIFRNLIPYWKSIIAIILLLMVQAYCDLSLPPCILLNIIDTNQSSGVEHIVPER